MCPTVKTGAILLKQRPCAVITGASSGIGRELAELVAADAHVVLIARNKAALQQTAERITGKGGTSQILSLDLSLANSGQALEDYLAANGLYCETLVTSAGLGQVGLSWQLPLSEQLAAVDVNVRSLSDLVLRFLPGMIERGGGKILTVSSIASAIPGPGMAVYYATKAYTRMFSEALWQETRGTGVMVTCLCPGPVDTDFISNSGAEDTPLFRLLRHKGAYSVALDGWEGLKAGRMLIVPGLTAKILFGLARLLPNAYLLPWLLNKLTKTPGGRASKND
jgi:uncharacterized protein